MRQDACAAHSGSVGQDGNRYRRKYYQKRAPECPAPKILETPATRYPARAIVALRASEIGEDDRQCDERHQGTNAATGFHNLQLLRLTCAERQQLYDVALS